MSQWTCNDGMSDDELSPTTVVINSPSPSPPPPNHWVQVSESENNTNRRIRIYKPYPVNTECSLSPSPTPSPTKSDHFYTDGCGDRPYAQGSRERANSESPPPVPQSETKTTETDGFNYPKRNYQYYNEPRIVVDYTSELYSVRESGTKQDYISVSDVFNHISLGGRLPRDLLQTLECNISDKIFESFTGTDDEVKEFTNIYWKSEGVSTRYNTNFVGSPYKKAMFLTRNYDIILAECTKAFLKYNDQVIY